jgi:hypothetical protein
MDLIFFNTENELEEVKFFKDAIEDKEIAKNLEEYISLKQDYAHIFSSETGKRVLKDLMDKLKVFNLSYDKQNSTAFNEGKRFAGLHIANMVTPISAKAWKFHKKIKGEK